MFRKHLKTFLFARY